ncbi:MAG: AprI/Inh family metalloprotease inhibitor [Proteobacteria bacterium]|nr:AprI/Inh family metalloprotease inhibitor [Pseudomonadota bacterium]
MRRALCLAGLVVVTAAGAARAYDFPPLQPMNESAVEPALLADVFGTWELGDRSGKRRCRIVLLKEMGIGGRQVEVAPGCEKAFPVMGDIAAWRLQEGWTIDLIDPLRKTRIRLETPDERYIAIGDDKDVAGIDTFTKLETRAPKKK